MNANLAKLTLTRIELHSHGYAIAPCPRDDSHIAGFNYRVQLMFDNSISVCVSLKDLREIKHILIHIPEADCTIMPTFYR